MSNEPAIIALLRESLERELPHEGAPIMLEALRVFASTERSEAERGVAKNRGVSGGSPPRMIGASGPSSFTEVVDFVRGPLQSGLAGRCGAERAAEIVHGLEQTLKRAELPTAELERLRARGFDEETTANFAAVAGQVDLVLVSVRGELLPRLKSSFAAGRVAVVQAHDADALARAARRMDIAIVDASDLPPIPGDVLARTLSTASYVLVWACESAGADALVGALEQESVKCIGFPSNELLEPMLDVVRSRIR